MDMGLSTFLAIGSLLSFLLAGYFFYRSKIILSLAFILLMSGGIKSYFSLDEYLHEWDERCHALVAKNMISEPLKPMLYVNPVEPYDHRNWLGNLIWLMKPPIPLWGMSLSLSIFGISEFAVRIPGILFALGSVVLTFLIARRLFGEKAALLAAFMHGIHGMLSELASGRLSSDGVEACFLFFVELAVFSVFYVK